MSSTSTNATTSEKKIPREDDEAATEPKKRLKKTVEVRHMELDGYLLPSLVTIVSEYAVSFINKWKLHFTNSVIPDLLQNSLNQEIRFHNVTFVYDETFTDFDARKVYIYGNLGSIYKARNLLIKQALAVRRIHLPMGVLIFFCEPDKWSYSYHTVPHLGSYLASIT